MICVLDFVGTHHKYGYCSFSVWYDTNIKTAYFYDMCACLGQIVMEEEPSEENLWKLIDSRDEEIEAAYKKYIMAE